ncbi:MAG: methyltransferase domain-containing protein [Candidatus Omnitrophica bacterium]|nr:methyltransferase domain-containing protein [Candidatus Omnitrophota bacterium]
MAVVNGLKSEAGERWRPFYQRGDLSWFDPTAMNRENLLRYGKSEWISRMLKQTVRHPGSKTRVLEAGCGTGMFAVSLALLGFRVDAFDYNEEAISIGKGLWAKVQTEGEAQRIRFTRGNLLQMGIPSDTYDLVFNQAVLEYFTQKDQRKRAIDEMVRVTKPGGHVAIIVQHTAHPWKAYWEKLGWPGYTDQPPVDAMTADILAEEMSDSGLQNVVLDGIYPWKTLFFWPPWYRRYSWTSEMIYLLGQFFHRMVPVPRTIRKKISLQILGVGVKK